MSNEPIAVLNRDKVPYSVLLQIANRGDTVVKELSQAAAVLPERLRKAVLSLPDAVAAQTLEVRLYAASPVRLVTTDAPLFLYPDGTTDLAPKKTAVSASSSEIEETVLRACGFSLHTVQKELSAGFLPLPGGHRLGVCGKAVRDADGKVRTVTDFSSLNLRIAHFLPDTADRLCETLFSKTLSSVILAGPPLCGKTTMLRALAHRLSTGACGCYYRVSVVDTRQEFSPLPFCDVLRGREKADSIECALRTLSPQRIICDEIADAGEVHALSRGFSAGCACAVSVHVGSEKELMTRAPFRALVQTGQFSHIVFPDRHAPGNISCIRPLQELCA